MSDAEVERDEMEFDVVVVGAGPAGLAAAIRLKQLQPELSVVVLEKGAEVGAHILSGAVIDPIGLDRLLPGWRAEETPVRTPVTSDHFYVMGPAGRIRVPNFLMPPLMSNHGNFVVSLGNVCRWLAGKAEELGVEIFPGFAAAETVIEGDGIVTGVITGDMGIGRDGARKDSFTPGMALKAKYTLIAEGARGSLARQLIARFGLDLGRSPAKFGLGLKELWRIDPAKHDPGRVEHSFGWPLNNSTGGGSFLYHLEDNQVAIGFVVHLNYRNPHLSPFQEFQRFKTHPAIRAVLSGGERIAYGARTITEGGWQAVPRLCFPGGALIGCAAGFVNVPRIKGSHNAILSGMLAAEHAAAAIAEGRAHDELTGYEEDWRQSDIGRDLYPVRNVKPLWSRFGTIGGVLAGGLDMWASTLIGSPLGTLKHRSPEYATLRPAKRARPIAYPRPDGEVSFDLLSSVYLTNTNHEEDQPSHLRLVDPARQKEIEYDIFGGPSARYCPAGVYEWLEEPDGPRFQINAQNCIHCKTCDIKDPEQNIVWTVPEGGGGPNYPNM